MININDLASMDMSVNNNNSNNEPLPANFQLVPFKDDENDEAIMDYLWSCPPENNLVPNLPTTQENKLVTTNNTTMMSSMPVVPKMYFPHSNVTINYNFSK